MASIQQPWIDIAYRTFAFEGPSGLRVERIAKHVGKNKSSFYHHFADMEVFTNLLLEKHLAQAAILAEKEAACRSEQELIGIILDHKVDLLFNRQLRIHREQASFMECFVKTNELVAKSLIGIWMHILELKEHTELAKLLLKLSLENFYLQITEETLNLEWLQKYFQELRKISREFHKSGRIPSALDAGV